MMENRRYSSERLLKFTNTLFCAAGVDATEAEILARVFLWSDLVGRYNHGLRRVTPYLKRFEHGVIASPARLEYRETSVNTCVLDGGNGFGQYVGHVAMQRAVAMAGESGIGIVAVRNSNNYGVGAYYAQLAAENNQIGLALSNSFPKVAPHGGVEALLGTNPFSFAAPVSSGRSVLVDFSTGAAAGSTISRAKERGEPLPEGLALDPEGRPITDPAQVARGALLPFGGAKGYGLGLLVEILCGVLAGAGISREVGSMFQDFSGPGNHGHFLLALNIEKFMPLEVYFTRIERLVHMTREVKPQPGVARVRLPGEQRWALYEQQMREGVLVEEKTLEMLAELARKYAVPYEL